VYGTANVDSEAACGSSRLVVDAFAQVENDVDLFVLDLLYRLERVVEVEEGRAVAALAQRLGDLLGVRGQLGLDRVVTAGELVAGDADVQVALRLARQCADVLDAPRPTILPGADDGTLRMVCPAKDAANFTSISRCP
jgi:hypothetical protein